jgi:hypothetical protein
MSYQSQGRTGYETDRDLKEEEAAARDLEIISGGRRVFKKLSAQVWRVDWVALAGESDEICFFAEFRRRDINYGDYEDLRFCAAKWFCLRELAEKTNTTSRFFFRFKDCLAVVFIKKNQATPKIAYWGRGKERDEFDKMPCVCVPWHEVQVVQRSKAAACAMEKT